MNSTIIASRKVTTTADRKDSIESIIKLLKNPKNRMKTPSEVLSLEQIAVINPLLAAGKMGSHRSYRYAWILGRDLKGLQRTGAIDDLDKAPLGCHPDFSREIWATAMRPGT